jgi:hypothetical protein
MMAQVRIGQEIVDCAFDDIPIGSLAAIKSRNLPFQNEQQFLEIGVLLAQAPKHLGHGRPPEPFGTFYGTTSLPGFGSSIPVLLSVGR